MEGLATHSYRWHNAGCPHSLQITSLSSFSSLIHSIWNLLLITVNSCHLTGCFATVSQEPVCPQNFYPFHLQSHSLRFATPGLWHPCIILSHCAIGQASWNCDKLGMNTNGRSPHPSLFTKDHLMWNKASRYGNEPFPKAKRILAARRSKCHTNTINRGNFALLTFAFLKGWALFSAIKSGRKLPLRADYKCFCVMWSLGEVLNNIKFLIPPNMFLILLFCSGRQMG